MYWWAGRDVAYNVGGTAMVLVTAFAWSGLTEPALAVPAEKKTE